MQQIRICFLLAALTFALAATAQNAGSAPASNAFGAQTLQPPAARVVDLKSSDGTLLKATYFAAGKPGPGMLLFHQSNRDRRSWDDVAKQLAAAGINTFTIDNRGHGESSGKYDNWTDPNKKQAEQAWIGDLDAAFEFLASQPGVNRDVIGAGGAGLLGVFNSVEVARRHSEAVKSLVLLSGETFRDGLQFLRQASQLPGLFVVADNDEYPPTVEAMELAYVTASSPYKKFVHYSALEEAPWLWYEPLDVGWVPATGGHGTDMFRGHPELPGIIVQWLLTTLIKSPGHAPMETLAAASVINQLETLGGAEQVAQQLREARQRDPKAQLFPEISASIVGFDFMRAGDLKSAIEVLRVVVMAYPDSADANDNLADMYLSDGQKDVARQHAEKALALLDSHAPASSWSNAEQQRDAIRRDAQKILKKLGHK